MDRRRTVGGTSELNEATNIEANTAQGGFAVGNLARLYPPEDRSIRFLEVSGLRAGRCPQKQVLNGIRSITHQGFPSSIRPPATG